VAAPLNGRAVAWGAATLALPGETECGDRHVVEAFEGGAMVALIDALGHGPEAARVAAVAAQTLAQHSREGPAALIQRCHAGLRGTRGAAVSLASYDAARGTLTWLGIGNVGGVLVSADPQRQPRLRDLLRHGGVVGDRLPELNPSVLPVAPGDALILTTDGVAHYYERDLPAAIDPELADRMLARFARRTDDAAVLVVCLKRGT
jgi:negative regulator of sigma-B (phosphoserine phosphatase)